MQPDPFNEVNQPPTEPSRTPSHPDLPKLPDPAACGDGYGWMEALARRWHPIPSWRGAEIGDWPYACVAIYQSYDGDLFAVALYLEGGVELTLHNTREDFRARLDELVRRFPND